MPLSRRQFLALGASTPLAIAVAACLGSSNGEVEVTAEGSPVGAPTVTPVAPAPTPRDLPFTPTPPPSDLDPDNLAGFTMPVEGACLPGSDLLMPNAPREYRNGVHEGVDFYFGDSCVVIDRRTPVVAMYDGVVIRADHDYRELTAEQLAELQQRTSDQGFTDEDALDVYRGRQVWIDHGSGVSTRYCHLEFIESTVAVGLEVAAGDRVGGIGESGTPESVTAPNTELHLHAEVRVGDSFLGEGLPPDEVRALYTRLLAPVSGA